MLARAIRDLARNGLTAAVVLTALASAGSAEARRLALVVGNGQYVNTDVLANPERDVDAVADRLRALHFEVAESKNVSGDALRSQITAFKRSVAEGDTVVIYYAGHGMEVGGHDYILPVNADIQNVGDVADWGYPLDGLFFTDKRNVAVIVVFDACRDNTFLRRTHSSTAGTSVINVPPGDMVIFSAGSGEVALDGDPAAAAGGEGQNSVFASALLGAMAAPNLDDRDLFVEVRRQVQGHSNQQQNPQIIGALNQKFVFNAQAGLGAAPTEYAAQSTPPPATQAAPPPPEPAPVQMAAAQQAPGASIYRSVPTPNEPLRPTPPPMNPAPAPPPPEPAPSAPATPAPPPPAAMPAAPAPSAQAAAAPAPVAPAPTSVAAAASAPPAPAPIQVASITSPAPLAGSPFAAQAVSAGYGSNAVETAVPKQPGVYTIASLGLNKMPPRPELTSVPPVNIPASFCSAQERNTFHDQTYQPAWKIASVNNDMAIKYLDALNALHREYAEEQSGYVNQITREYNAYAPIAAEAFATSNRYTNMHDAIMAVPVGSCK